MRHLILFLFLLIPSLSWATTDQDDGLLWVALNLVDALEPGNPLIQDDWTVPCSDVPEPGAPPHGFVLKSIARKLPTGLCEGSVVVRVGGWINDQFVFKRTLWWQPGEDGTNMIGIPREGTRSIKIVLPEQIQIGSAVYQAPEQILLRPTGIERVVKIDVKLYQLPSVELAAESDQIDLRGLMGSQGIWVSDTEVFIGLDPCTIRAPREYLLEATAIDRLGNTRRLTPAVQPQAYVDLVGYYGWTFQVQVVPKHPTRITKR